MVDGPRAGAAERRAEEFREIRLALVDGLLWSSSSIPVSRSIFFKLRMVKKP